METSSGPFQMPLVCATQHVMQCILATCTPPWPPTPPLAHLVVVLAQVLLDRGTQLAAVARRQLHAGEEVGQQRHEQRQVQVHQLGADEVQHRPARVQSMGVEAAAQWPGAAAPAAFVHDMCTMP
jgi:hypothetical protein